MDRKVHGAGGMEGMDFLSSEYEQGQAGNGRNISWSCQKACGQHIPTGLCHEKKAYLDGYALKKRAE